MTKPRAPPLWFLVRIGSTRIRHITLLTDIRTAFNRYDKDRLRTKAELIPALAGLEDSPWGEWAGPDGAAGPPMLTQCGIGRFVPPLASRSKSLGLPGRRPATQLRTGYSPHL